MNSALLGALVAFFLGLQQADGVIERTGPIRRLPEGGNAYKLCLRKDSGDFVGFWIAKDDRHRTFGRAYIVQNHVGDPNVFGRFESKGIAGRPPLSRGRSVLIPVIQPPKEDNLRLFYVLWVPGNAVSLPEEFSVFASGAVELFFLPSTGAPEVEGEDKFRASSPDK